MSEKTMNDQRLNERVHDAYQSFSPSDEAAERVLASLRKAQSETDEPTKRPVRWWKIALPLAACLVLAVVIVQLQTPNGFTAADTEQVKSEQQEYEAESNAAVEADAAMEEALEEVVVTLADHTTYVVGEPMTEPPTYSELEEADANGRPCVVADHEYMRYVDDETWYEVYPK